MPPKKELPKKPTPQAVRPPISDASLMFVPDDAIEGFQERIETGIDWTLVEEGGRHHRNLCCRAEISSKTFTEALENKIKNSILNGFLDEKSPLTLDEHWEIIMPLKLWDNDKCSNEEGKVCFRSVNCITENMIPMIKKAVKAGQRNVLKQDLKMVHVLRVNDCQMTALDEGLKEYPHLVTLNLCGNFISEIDPNFLPKGLKILELQLNAIRNIESFVERLSPHLSYLGLARNLLDDDVKGLARLPHNLTVLDLSDNDIYHLLPVLDALRRLPNLISLSLAGNPCSVSSAYARTTISVMHRLKWLDSREVLPTDHPEEPYEAHPDDLRSAYFTFTILRIMSVPPPPKIEKGTIQTFHVELELPLLDVDRRRFLMFRRNDSLTEMLLAPEDYESLTLNDSKTVVGECSSLNTDVYAHLTTRNPREVRHYTTFESTKIQWNKVMNFQEPTLRIFCPDLVALRNTFRTVITLRLIYTQTTTVKGKSTGKSIQAFKPQPMDQTVKLATIKCTLQRPDWSQTSQHFHWDDTLGTNKAIHWGDGDLSVLQYIQQTTVKTPKSKTDSETVNTKHLVPDNLTCHFAFGIDTYR